MSLFDYFRRAIIPPNHPGHPGFRNPIWEEDTDEDDDELDDEFRYSPASPFSFRIFSGDVMELHKYFEQQMDEMFKSFNSSLFGQDLLELPDSSFINPSDELGKNVGASKYLKPGYDLEVQDSNAKKDTDLDGRVTSGDLKTFFSDGEGTSQVPSKVIGQSVITRIIRTSDGRLEKEKRVRASDGREEVSLTRQIGDQKYKVITKKDSQSGVTNTTEELINLDEDKLTEFNKKWDHSKTIAEAPKVPNNESVIIYPPDNGNRVTKLFEKWFK